MNRYKEIVGSDIQYINFKNPQYAKKGFTAYWKKFISLFKLYFSEHFEIITEINYKRAFLHRVLYIEAMDKNTLVKTLIILSLPEGHMNKTDGKLLCRLKFKSELFKSYLANNNPVLFVTLYANLNEIPKNNNIEDVVKVTNFKETLCIISTLQEVWNSSKRYGERYKAIIDKTNYVKGEIISMHINFRRLLDVFNGIDYIQKNIILKIDKNLVNLNELWGKKIKRKNECYNIFKLSDAPNLLDYFNMKNYDFIKWIDQNHINKFQETKAINKNLCEQVENFDKNFIKRLLINDKIVSTIFRVGQKDFRKSLLNEFKHCPITKISNDALLLASHIKPYSACDDHEKYDINNGLLLSPMYDKLFDKGLISFSDNGSILISNILDQSVLKYLNLPVNYNFDLKLNEERKKYLDYHREYIFKNKYNHKRNRVV